MALFGDLQHHALADLANVLHTRTGTLVFRSSYQGQTLELVLKTGQLHAIYVDGVPAQTLPEARTILGQLHTQGHGAFEFRTQKLLMDDVRLYDEPFAELVGQLVDETSQAAVSDHDLPHPETRFIRTSNPVQVPDALTPVWTAIKSHLASGRSAAELSMRTGLPQQDLLVALYRLRALNLIAPQRAIPTPMARPAPLARPIQTASLAQAIPTHATPAPGALPAAPPPLVQRLLSALRRLTRGDHA